MSVLDDVRAAARGGATPEEIARTTRLDRGLVDAALAHLTGDAGTAARPPHARDISCTACRPTLACAGCPLARVAVAR